MVRVVAFGPEGWRFESHEGLHPRLRQVREAGELTNPVIQVYGRPHSVTGAFYLPWGLDVLSNERRLARGL